MASHDVRLIQSLFVKIHVKCVIHSASKISRPSILIADTAFCIKMTVWSYFLVLSKSFDVFLTVHLSIILVMHKFLFYNKFNICLYMFRALLCSSSGGQNCIIQHLVSSHSVGGRHLSTCAPDGHLHLWLYQMLYNQILTSWWWAQQCSKHVVTYDKLIIKDDFVH